MRLFTLISCFLAGAALAAPLRAGGQSAECLVRELSRTTLALEDRHDAYVEPETLVRAADAILLAGTPTYVLRRDPAGRPVSLARDSLVGAILEADGRVRGLIRPPVDGRPVEWRAVSLGERSWGVTFVEVPPPTEDSVGAYVDGRLWYGTVSDGRWSSLGRVPHPPGWKFLTFSTSKLARRADTLAVAVRMDSAALVRRVVLFEHRHGRWAHSVLPFDAAYVDLAHVDGLGFITAVARADSRRAPGSNALYLYVPGSTGRARRGVGAAGETRRVETGDAGAVHEPALAGDSGTPVLTWWTVVTDPPGVRFQARAVLDPLASPPEAAHALDPDVNSIVHVATPEGMHLWLSDHVLTETSRELRLLAVGAGDARVLWATPNPFDGTFRAVALPGRRVLFLGPSFDRSRGVLTNLMVQLELECRPSS